MTAAGQGVVWGGDQTACVAVIGAGPAGAVAATKLARAGRRVAVLGPVAPSPRIAESLPAAGVRLLRRLDLPVPDVGAGAATDGRPHRPILGSISAWGGPPIQEDSFTSPEGPGWRLDRLAFDHAVLGVAQVAGAEHVPTSVAAVQRDGGGWTLRLASGRVIRASTLVDATGRKALIARRLGAKSKIHARRTAIWAQGQRADPAAPNRTLIESTPAGWWYGTRAPDGTPVAVLHTDATTTKALRATPEQWHTLLRKTRLITRHLDPDAFAAATSQFREAGSRWLTPPVGDGWIACGDAALALDPVSSQGLINAIGTAALAADTILAADRSAAAQRYSDQLTAQRDRFILWHDSLYARLGRVAAAETDNIYYGNF